MTLMKPSKKKTFLFVGFMHFLGYLSRYILLYRLYIARLTVADPVIDRREGGGGGETDILQNFMDIIASLLYPLQGSGGILTEFFES